MVVGLCSLASLFVFDLSPPSSPPQLEPSLPPVQKLVIPVAASLSGNRSVSFRPSLTPGGAGRFLDRTFRDTVSTARPQVLVRHTCST